MLSLLGELIFAEGNFHFLSQWYKPGCQYSDGWEKALNAFYSVNPILLTGG